MTVRATETSWVAPVETTKLPGELKQLSSAILPAATGELHLLGCVPDSLPEAGVIRSQA